MQKFFLVKAKIEVLTEKGKLKKVTEQYMVQAEDVKEAEVKFRNETKEFMDFPEISSISETKIIDIFKYQSENN